jgi:hypothetical protein
MTGWPECECLIVADAVGAVVVRDLCVDHVTQDEPEED